MEIIGDMEVVLPFEVYTLPKVRWAIIFDLIVKNKNLHQKKSFSFNEN